MPEQKPEYRDQSVLEELYVEQRKSMNEIAEQFGVGRETIRRWLKKHNIETRPRGSQFGHQPWHDEKTLRNLYHGQGLSLAQVGKMLGCDRSTVRHSMERLGIERRTRIEALSTEHAVYSVDSAGYPKWRDSDRQLRVHRLLAIALGASPYEIFSGANVHHKNGIPWDNRPENIEVLDKSEHHTIHAKERAKSPKSLEKLRDADWLECQYIAHEKSISTIADEIDVSYATVHYWIEKHEIEKREPWEWKQE